MAAKVSPEEIAAFEALPEYALIDDRMIEAIMQVSPATIWRMRRDGRLPKVVKITKRSVRTRVGELREALAAFSAE
ncbi:MAG: transcriptional regulator [Burkholderiales bacterium]|nr:transcriptional regulator [Burkholderiales bacterium]